MIPVCMLQLTRRTTHTVSETYVPRRVFMFLFMYRDRGIVLTVGHV